MVAATYDDITTGGQTSEEDSLHSTSLSNLGLASDKASNKIGSIKYNRKARKLLRKRMSLVHFKKHCCDIENALRCHRMTYRSLPPKYAHGPEVLSRCKLYALIYLGLLIVKDKVQLGDMLRFIREGHLSYHIVNHFFPEDHVDNQLNIKTWNKGHTLLCHYAVRSTAADIAKLIEVTTYIPVQDLVQLCHRYCEELNLPG